MLVSGVLRIFHWDLTFEKTHPGMLGKVWFFFHGSKTIIALLGLFTVLPLVAIAGQRLSFLEANKELFFVVCMYSGAAQSLMHRRHRPELGEACLRLAILAEEVEAVAEGGQLRALARQGGLGLRTYLCMRAYGGTAFLMGVVQFLLKLQPPCEMWVRPLQPWEPLAMFLALLYVMLVTVSVTKVAPDFTAMVVCVAMASCALHREVAFRLRSARDDGQLRRTACLLVRLGAATRTFTALFGGYLGHALAFTLLAPALSTLSLVMGGYDTVTVTLLPVIFLMFIPICFAGDLLEEASGELMGRSAYASCWPELAAGSRRLVLNTMSLSRMARQSVRVDGLGTLNKKTSYSTVSIWFKYLQALLNMHWL